MAGFLQSLGAFGAGAAPGIADYAQSMNNNALGNALSDIYGGTKPQPSAGPLGSIGTLLQGLGGGASAPSPQLPAMQPTSIPQGPRAPLPQNAPLVANAGGGLPAAPTPQQQPQAAPQQAPQTPPPPPQAPRPQLQQQQAPQSNGPLDIPTLVRSLTAHGITGHRLVDALHTAVPLLNAQGLAQYRDLGLQLRREHEQNLETDREFNRNPTAAGSRAQSRVANQGIALQRLDGVQKRFEVRTANALDKLKNAKTDKEAADAKKDVDKIASALKGELASELQIANGMNTTPEEQKAALAKAAEIRQQMEQATSEAVQAHRSGGANGDQVGGIKGSQRTAPEVVQGKQVHQIGETRTFNGQTYHYVGGDWDAQESWAPGQ